MPHLTIILIENPGGATFELEMIRRFEGVPSDQAQSLEKRQVLLSDAYSSPLDIIRRIDVNTGLKVPLSR